MVYNVYEIVIKFYTMTNSSKKKIYIYNNSKRNWVEFQINKPENILKMDFFSYLQYVKIEYIKYHKKLYFVKSAYLPIIIVY